MKYEKIKKEFVMKPIKICLTLLFCLSFWILGAYATAMAGVTAEEAAKLKTTLTPFGAERAGNAEGTIPAWDGGITEIPACDISTPLRATRYSSPSRPRIWINMRTCSLKARKSF